MRLLYVFPEPLPLYRARSFQAVRTAVALAESGIDVTLAHVPGASDPFIFHGVSRPDYLHAVTISRALPWPLSGIRSNRVFFRRLVRETRNLTAFDLVFARHLKFSAMFLEQGPSVPLVYEAHEVFADTAPASKRRRRSAEEQVVVDRAAAVVANSHGTASRIRELYGQPLRVEVIPNGVDRPARLPEKDWKSAGRKIVYAGSMFPWKGVADLVAAGAWLPGCRIEIIGGDKTRIDELRAQLPTGGAEFAFSGQLPHPEVIDRLAGACIAVLPNRESTDSAFTSPIKLFEYMACGCAVVSSDLPVLREVLGDSDAVWVRPGCPENLARAIQTLATDSNRAAAMGARLRDLSAAYSWSARGERLKTLFDSLVNSRHA